jgi:hypothetical protein
MAVNPFYIDPGNDYSSGLSGLSNTMSNIRQGRIAQAKQDAIDAQAQRQAEANDAAAQAFKAGDPAQMAQVSLKYPEIADNLRKTIGLDTENKQKEAGDFARRLLTAAPEERPSIYEDRINSLHQQGRDPTHTMQSYQDYQKNPNGELQSLESVWAATDPNGYNVIAEQHKAEQKAQSEDRKYQFEDKKLGQQLTIAQMNSQDKALSRQIQMLNAQQAGTMNDLKRQELGLQIASKTQAQQDLQQKQYDAVGEKVKAGTSAISQMDTAIDTAKQLLAHPALTNPGLTSAVGQGSILPTRPGGESADFEALLDTFKAQNFLPVVQSLKGAGLGALSDAEGAKLTASTGALSLKTNPKMMTQQLHGILDRLEKSKNSLSKELVPLSTRAQRLQPPGQAAAQPNQAQSQAAPAGVKFLGFE